MMLHSFTQPSSASSWQKQYQGAWNPQTSAGLLLSLMTHMPYLTLRLLRLHTEQSTSEHSVNPSLNWRQWSYNCIQHSCHQSYWTHTKHPWEQCISCWQFASKILKGANSQDFVFIRPPGILHGVFELWMDTFGSARFCSCFKWSRKQTWAGKGTRVHSSQLWRNTLVLSGQV